MIRTLAVPLRYSVDHSRRQVLQVGADPIDPAEVLTIQDRQASDGAWHYQTLADLSRVQEWVPTADEIRTFISHVQGIQGEHGSRGPLALVARHNSALFGMFRMYSILGGQANAVIEAFTTVSAAERWLAERGAL